MSETTKQPEILVDTYGLKAPRAAQAGSKGGARSIEEIGRRPTLDRNSAIITIPQNANQKDNYTMTLTKFADRINGINSRIDALKASTTDLTLAEKRILLEALENGISAATSAADAPKKRLAAVSAAAASKDKRTSAAYKNAVAGLAALGKKIDQIAAAGDVRELDRLMKESAWSADRKVMLKNALNIVGAI